MDVDLDRSDTGAVAFRLLCCRPAQTLSLPEQIAARVGDRIIAEGYRPGDRIIEQDLAQEFQVSRGPIREALRLLEHEGLIRLHPRRGAQVTALTEQEVIDVFEVRAALLRIVSERLAATRSPAAIAMLERGIALLERHATDPDGAAAYAETTFRLGLTSVNLVANATLAEIVMSLSLRTLRYTRMGLASQARRQESLGLWRRALDAIRNGDIGLAGDMIVARVTGSRDEALRRLRQRQAAEQADAA